MQQDYFLSAKYEGAQSFSQQNINSANATGFGAAADNYTERGIDLTEELIRNKPATFFMRVNSDAMKESCIYKDDVVIVDRSLKAVNSKIIIAILHGDMLIRRMEKTNTPNP